MITLENGRVHFENGRVQKKWTRPFENGRVHFEKWTRPKIKWTCPFLKMDASIFFGRVHFKMDASIFFQKWTRPFHRPETFARKISNIFHWCVVWLQCFC